MVWPHTGRPSAASPQPPSGRDGADVQLPGHTSRGQTLDSPALTDRQDAGTVGRVTSRPQPARLGALDMSQEALVEWHPPTRTTRSTRAGAGRGADIFRGKSPAKQPRRYQPRRVVTDGDRQVAEHCLDRR